MSVPQGPGQPNNNGNPFNNPFRQNGNKDGGSGKPGYARLAETIRTGMKG